MISAGWGAGACLVLAFGLAWIWRRLGWGDAASGAEASRKRQHLPVPAVGGLAIAGAWAIQFMLSGDASSWSLNSFAADPATGGPAALGWPTIAALVLALASGAIDDVKRGGLRPAAKVVLQLAAGALLTWQNPTLVSVPLLAGLSVLHQNAINTFDNADGAAAGLTAAGLFACGSPLAPVVLVFLLPNLFMRTRSGDPRAYLGDAGSQLLGMAVLLTPGAWPILVLPLLDLLGVCVQRLRRGIAPWRGDRRHLAHRLQRLGLGPVAVSLTLLVAAGPVLLAPGALGLGLTSVLYGLLLYRTRHLAEASSALQ